MMGRGISARGIAGFIGKYKYILLVAAAGLVLILWQGGTAETPPASLEGYEPFDLAQAEAALAGALSELEGAGKVRVVLTLKTDMTLILQENHNEKTDVKQEDGVVTRKSETKTETVLIGSGANSRPVVVRRVYPEYRGALVVCEGGASAAVRLAVIEALSSVTGLGADRITVCTME